MTVKPLQITVMLGGPSEEREVSLRGGQAVARALRSLGHRVTELDPVPGKWKLPEGTEKGGHRPPLVSCVWCSARGPIRAAPLALLIALARRRPRARRGEALRGRASGRAR